MNDFTNPVSQKIKETFIPSICYEIQIKNRTNREIEKLKKNNETNI